MGKKEINNYAQANLLVAAKVRSALYNLDVNDDLSDVEKKICWRGWDDAINTNDMTPEEVADQLRQDILDTIKELAY